MVYHCPKKVRARLDTVINPYRELFLRAWLPEDKHYWTLCSDQTENGTLSPMGELGQLVLNYFVSPFQFYGVDIDERLITKNRNAVPEAHWHHGDFHEIIASTPSNPGIVNYDSLKMPEQGSEYLVKLMDILSSVDDVMLVGNFVLDANHRHVRPNAVVAQLDRLQSYREQLRLGWKTNRQVYVYPGSGGTRTRMGTVLHWKQKTPPSLAGL